MSNAVEVLKNCAVSEASCNWPFCGCDPHAVRVLNAINEAGFSLVKRPSGFKFRHDPEIETAAKKIYESYDGASAYPWVEHGNSTMQDKARREAEDVIASLQNPPIPTHKRKGLLRD